MTTSGAKTDPGPSAQVVRAYHERTKHRPEAYAAGPETIDWENQPAPFRHFSGADAVALPRSVDPHLANRLESPFSFSLPASDAAPPSLETLGMLLYLSFGITAWKSFGPDRWAVRANPSSGNLHPVEAYLIVRGLAELAAGVYHYCVEDHTLECRARFASDEVPRMAPPRVWVGLTTVMWRETWKYGERAFRYCQLDTGHAIAAVSYASAVLGWRVFEEPHIGTESLARGLGLDRSQDFRATRDPETEKEEAELLLAVSYDGPPSPHVDGRELRHDAERAEWRGIASLIDAHPMVRWPIVHEIAAATRTLENDGDRPTASERAGPDAVAGLSARKVPRVPLGTEPVPRVGAHRPSAVEVIVRRRSAQRFDSRHCLEPDDFFGLLTALMPSATGPLRVVTTPREIAFVLFVHRVRGLQPGVYLTDPSLDGTTRLASHFPFAPVEGSPSELDLRLIAPVEPRHLARAVRALHCHQDLAAQACFALGMIARFDEVVDTRPAAYRTLHREAGMLGHVLYLEAEARGLRGTGIGCFFDDSLHEMLQLADTQHQTLYHFAVGKPIDDPRIETAATAGPLSACNRGRPS